MAEVEYSYALPDTKYFLNAEQIKKVKSLIKNECCYYSGGNCDLLDNGKYHKCVQESQKKICCKHFLTSVMPLDSVLEAGVPKPKETKSIFTPAEKAKMRKANGSLFRMSEEQSQKAQKLIINNCNHLSGKDCLLLSKPDDEKRCPQLVSNTVCCAWFANAVMSYDEKFDVEIFGVMRTRKAKASIKETKPKMQEVKKCEICGKQFIARNNKAKYCEKCAKTALRRQQAEYNRKRRKQSSESS